MRLSFGPGLAFMLDWYHMTTSGALALISVLGLSNALAQPTASPDPTSGTVPDADQSGSWLFPAEKLNHALPGWVRLGGEYRSRLESADGIGFSTTDDTYLLSRFRFHVTIQPTPWLIFFGEAQDSHVFFNSHIPEASPYQDPWDIRQAYVQLGSSTEGWVNLVVGRQNFVFGSERVIGPSDWLNQGRTFDTVRLDVHHTGYKVSLFASSVVIADANGMDHHLEGNNFYGIYGSFTNAIPGSTVEPYVLWRLAPANAGLPETANRGHLSETTVGLRMAGKLPAAFDYEIEMDRQTGSLGANSIRHGLDTGAWAERFEVSRRLRGFSSNRTMHQEPRIRAAIPGVRLTRSILRITTRSTSRTNSAGKTFNRYAQE